MSSYLPVKNCRLGYPWQTHGTTGKSYPVIHDTEGDDLEGKGGNCKIVVTDAAGRDANNSPKRPERITAQTILARNGLWSFRAKRAAT